jgi:hypothetical protein
MTREAPQFSFCAIAIATATVNDARGFRWRFSGLTVRRQGAISVAFILCVDFNNKCAKTMYVTFFVAGYIQGLDGFLLSGTKK